jgi:RsiW-degrading membrane proteinase PrsW (M82 family)
MTLFLTFGSLFAAVIPITFFLFLIWRWDLYDRKPLWLMGGAFLWGALGSVPLAIVGQILLDPVFSELFGSEAWGLSVAIGAPITEEPAKALILVLLIRSRRFNNICDGFVFGAAAGLGFGMTENAKYFIESALAIGESYDATGQWVQLVVTRTLFCAVMHGTATSLVGAAAGISKFNRASIRSFSICIGMALALGMHALWNGLLVTEISPGKSFLRLSEIFGSGADMEPFLYSAFFFVIELTLVLILFTSCMWWEGRKLRRSLYVEAERGNIPKEHVPFLSSYFRRRKEGWLDNDIPKEEYIRLTTHLAQRGYQVEAFMGKRKDWYTLDYRRLKEEIKDLLHNSSSLDKSSIL